MSCARTHYVPEPVDTAGGAEEPTPYSFILAFPECSPTSSINLGICDASWASAYANVLSMRRCRLGLGYQQLSVQYLVDCLDGCYGSDTRMSVAFLRTHGVPAAACVTYTSGSTGLSHPCPTTCDDGSALLPFRIADAHVLSGNSTRIIEELLSHGPVYAELHVYTDFVAYKQGVYSRTTTQYVGREAVAIVGFGFDETWHQPYWLVLTSRGQDWGEGGYVRIVRGRNECGIESTVIAIDPVIES
ncbi:Cathepsin B [Giardia muris]|uniref:Cathepsin B n=1 Tax=Giardia muris TaxID=5742 RepID=A0A4Z1SNX1_GIAMU|nr:Cathepsin B [Giardia muris]|eukprot:TNJ26555.1 Cathepsin B [Giardia muris]